MTPEEIRAMIERDERFVAGEPDYNAHFDWAERLSPAERAAYRQLLAHPPRTDRALSPGEEESLPRLSSALWNLLQATARVWRI